MRFGRSWGKEDLEHARRLHRHNHAAAASAAGSKSRGGWREKVQNHQNGEELVQSLTSTLVDCYFVHLCTLGVGALAVCARRTTLKRAASSSTATRRAGYVAPWVQLTATRCLHVPALTKTSHVVKVYAMSRRHMWAVKAWRKGRGQGAKRL